MHGELVQGADRAEAISRARTLAEQRAAGAGACDLTLVKAEDIPIAYLPDHALRVRAKVVGNIASTPERPVADGR
jgi:phosphoserine phosphatase